jgi:hypothetical protein
LIVDISSTTCFPLVFVANFTSLALYNQEWRDHCAEHYIFVVVIAIVIKGRGEISLVARHE